MLQLVAAERAVQAGACAGGVVDGDLALEYALRARACLNGAVRRDELEALTDAVVNRES